MFRGKNKDEGNSSLSSQSAIPSKRNLQVSTALAERARSPSIESAHSDISIGGSSIASQNVLSSTTTSPLIPISFALMTPESMRSPLNINPKKLNSLHRATYENDIKKIRLLLLKKKTDINKLDRFHGFSAMHLATAENKLEIVKLLLNPPLEKKSDSGGKIPVIEGSKRIRLDMTNHQGRTALTLV